MKRLRKWHKRSRVSGAKDRNLTFALTEIDKMASQLGLPKKAKETGAKIYREATKNDLVRGRCMESVASAALYLSCRKNQIPRSLAEVSSHDKNEIGKVYRFLSQKLDINTRPIDPVQYVSRFGSELGISGETRANEIIRKAKEKGITSGKKPSATGAAAIHIASKTTKNKKTQKEIAEVANTTEGTIRSRYKEIVEKLDLKYINS